MLGVGTCILSPSLVITKPQVDVLVATLKESIELMAAEFA
jgi:adenosylmethionine-8-amino-7-oxononanoate aminotransferase